MIRKSLKNYSTKMQIVGSEESIDVEGHMVVVEVG
jgi:hypothetical protein